jgi:hypothetical protein
MEAVRSAKYSLTAAIASTEGASVSLPYKDVIAPNQHSWPETAERMGVKRVSKRKRLPEEHGLTERSIGVAKGKWQRIHQDPYAGGEQSGKHTKPDALSVAANECARALAASSSGAQVPAHASPKVFSP